MEPRNVLACGRWCVLGLLTVAGGCGGAHLRGAGPAGDRARPEPSRERYTVELVSPIGTTTGRAVPVVGRLRSRRASWEMFDVYVDGIHTKIGYADNEFEMTRVYKTGGRKCLQIAVFEDGALDAPIVNADFEFEVRLDPAYEQGVQSAIHALARGDEDWELLNRVTGWPDPLYTPYLVKLTGRLADYQWEGLLFAMAQAPSVEALPAAVAALGNVSSNIDDVPGRILSAVLGPKAYRELCTPEHDTETCRRRIGSWLSEKKRRAADARLNGRGRRVPWWK